MKLKLPQFFRWVGGSLPDKWSFGYLTGKEKDLICIRPDIAVKMEAEIALSPVCANRVLAISAFVLKVLLLRLDENTGVRRCSDDNPSKGYGSQ